MGIVKELVMGLAEALLIVAVIVSVAYAATGTWHVAFAVESGSMEPNMYRGDLIFVKAPSHTRIVTYDESKMTGHISFNDYGNVIIYRPNGLTYTKPIIHRAISWVEAGEKMPNGMVSPHEGYITKGDANSFPDQPMYSEPVKPEWVIGVAKIRVPYLGYARLIIPF